MLLHIHPDDPQARNIKTVVDCLRGGGVIIYPTDTIYGLGCDIYNTSAIERICRIKDIDPKKAQFSFVCNDLSHLSDFAKSISTPMFRLLKTALPGPYTFILEASKQVPKLLKTKKDTVGIRIPDHNISMAIVRELGHPIMSVSLPMDEDVEYYTDPELMHDRFVKQVDIVINGGMGGIIPSTVIDCTTGTAQLVREGAGDWENLLG
ncbi:MAG: threonylcarbamoyl-AMP synthase [Flavipsychrobacter sp.]|jgi:tRNA threonylcarbamoyl adenosine modification protein (Sua5/YciO/YrdC/YwlC family)|nr:threonylcarbamoyl-AMP synthase [Flavipsychrobacter sp.]